MISIEMEYGAGLSNQIWKLCVTRAIAYKNGYQYGILHPERFKGQHFLDVDMGVPVTEKDILFNYSEKKIMNSLGKDISGIDYDMLMVHDFTKIDGTMQSLKYFDGLGGQQKLWVRVKEPYKNQDMDNVCIVHIRGGDYLGAGLTLLTRKYFVDAMNYMLSINKDMKFAIVTDDINWSKYILPEIPIVGSANISERDPYHANHHGSGRVDIDFKLIYCAKNLIISNSSFSWWATYLNPNNPVVVAPKYWSAHNYDENFWSTNDMQVKGWKYLDKRGNID